MDVYSLVLRWDAPEVGLIENVFHYELDTSSASPPIDVAAALVDAFITNVIPEWVKICTHNMKLHSVGSKRVSLPGGPTFSRIGEAVGADPLDMDNTGISFCMAWIPTEAPYHIGHTYFAGIPDGSLLNNTWDLAYEQKVSALAVKLLLPLTLIGQTAKAYMVIWHRKLKTVSHIGGYAARSKPTAMNKRLAPYP